MCLAIPGKIKKILPDSNYAIVDFGGVEKKINVSFIKPKINKWVMVHVGFAIQTLTIKDAKETLKIYKEIFKKEKDGGNN